MRDGSVRETDGFFTDRAGVSAAARSRPYSPAHTRMRHRALAIAACLAVAVGAPAAYFAPLCAQYAEGPSAEAAIADANRRNGRELSYPRVRETEPDGSVVYRLVSTQSRPCTTGAALPVQVVPEPRSVRHAADTSDRHAHSPSMRWSMRKSHGGFRRVEQEQTLPGGLDWLSPPPEGWEMEAAEAEGASVGGGPGL